MKLFRKNRKIDFIIGGCQKGGTSALDYYLRQHPEIGMAKGKELHFFDNENIFQKSNVKYFQYEKQFNFRPSIKFYGEATSIYIYWKPCCQRIWEYNPDIKLIFILRNPIDRAFSHWNMEFNRNWDNYTFTDAIRNESIRIQETAPMQHRIYSYIDRGLYVEQIKRFINTFPRNQLLFIKYEEFNLNQEETLEHIFNFIGVDGKKFNFERKTVHKIKYHSLISGEDKEFLSNIFRADINELENILGWNCSDWLE